MTTQTNTAASAGTWDLGNLTVNRIGFGAMRLTGSVAFGPGIPGDRDRSIGVLRRAIELGVNHIDTAAFYFSPHLSANELINRALAPIRTTSSSPRKCGQRVIRRVNGGGPRQSSCAVRSRRTCASWGVTISTW